MTAIGSVIQTPSGPARVLTVLPGRSGREETAVTAPLDGGKPGQPDALSRQEEQRLRELQETDRAVRAEEKRHKAVAGAHGGTPHYDYVRGPDGKYYAVGGSVSVGTPKAASAQETERAARAIAAAARSVSTPSSADFLAAAQAERSAADARARLQGAATAYQGAGQPHQSARGGLVDISG